MVDCGDHQAGEEGEIAMKRTLIVVIITIVFTSAYAQISPAGTAKKYTKVSPVKKSKPDGVIKSYNQQYIIDTNIVKRDPQKIVDPKKKHLTSCDLKRCQGPIPPQKTFYDLQLFVASLL